MFNLNTQSFLSIVAFSIIFSFASCSKDSTTTTPPVTTSFTWQEDGGSVITADSAYWTTFGSGTGVRAYKGGMNNFFEINWSGIDTTVGKKTLNTGSFSDFTFIKAGTTYTNNTAQFLNITDNAGGKLTGNFEVAISGGTIAKIKANFSSLSKK